MAMTDAEVAMACDAWLAATDMTGTIFADGWPEKALFWPNAPTTPGVMILPRVEVRYMTIQPQQLALLGGGTARRQFVYVVTLVSKSQQFQYEAQTAADCLARRFLFGTRLKEVLLAPGFMTGDPSDPNDPNERFRVGTVGSRLLSLDMGGAMFTVSAYQYVGATFTLPGHPTAYTVVSHGVKTASDMEAVNFAIARKLAGMGVGLASTVQDNTVLTPSVDEAGDADAPGLWVRAPVQTGPGYQDGTEWRVPVTINLETLAKI